MILHIIKDGRLIDLIIRQFEKNLPGNFYYLVDSALPDKLMRVEPDARFVFAQEGSQQYFEYLHEFRDAKIVIIHALSKFHVKLINKFLQDKTICWVLWGGDIYGSGFIPHEYNRLAETRRHAEISSYRKIRRFLHKNKWRFPYLYPKYKAMKKVDYLVTVLPSEYDYLTSRMPYLKARQIVCNYPDPSQADQAFLPDIDFSNKTNILVSHNGYPTNNHFDTFLALERLNLENKKLIVPLSYGDHEYINKVIAYGKKHFPEVFWPITDYLPVDQYVNLLDTCSVAILNNIRQQGVGNLVVLVRSGAKIYLNKKGMAWSFMKDLGISVCSIEDDLVKENPDALKPLDIQTATENRDKIIGYFNQQELDRRTADLLTTLQAHS